MAAGQAVASGILSGALESGETPVATAGPIEEMTPLGTVDTVGSFDPANDPSDPENVMAMAAAAAESELLLARGDGRRMTCKKCGKLTSAEKQKCQHCGYPLKKEVAASAESAEQMVLLLAQDEKNHKLKCPKCDTVNPASAKTCKSCGHNLEQARKAKFANLGQEDGFDVAVLLHQASIDPVSLDDAEMLELAKLTAKARNSLPDSAFVLSAERKYPIHDEAHARNALARCAGKPEESKVKAAVYAKYPKLKEGSVAASQAEEHSATLYDERLSLAGNEYHDGLLWKVLCKTGTLALSPGPGQIDIEKPLPLTDDLFMAVKSAFDEAAYEKVLIPRTHEQIEDPLANLGTVDALEILSKTEAMADMRLSQEAKSVITADDDNTLYMLGGMRFTDAEAKKKAEDGSLLNCSVGIKFNVRPNKLTGKLYPAALEHVAPTNQPWVYGLPSFGARGAITASAPFNADELTPWDGVFMAQAEEEETPEPIPPAQPDPEENEPLPAAEEEDELTAEEVAMLSQRLTDIPAEEGGDTLSVEGDTGQIPSHMPELEEILASQQAAIEAGERDREALRKELALAQGTIASQGQQIHSENVTKKVRALQAQGIPPAVCTRVQDVLLAAYDPTKENSLELSVGGKSMGVEELVDHLVGAVPTGEPLVPADGEIVAGLAELHASQQEEKSPQEKADEIEKDHHPDRYDSDGKRKEKD